MTDLDKATQTELEAAAFRVLRDHLAARTDVQNIDMMNLAGFCRNCLSRWYGEATEQRGISMTKDEAREAFYGMPYSEWRDTYQTEATDQQKAAFEQAAAAEIGMSDDFDNELDEIMADTVAKPEAIPSGTPAAAALIQYIERVERLEEEKAGLMEDIKEVYGEAKGAGFDPKIMRAIVRLRKMEPADRQEQEALIETYKAAVGMG